MVKKVTLAEMGQMLTHIVKHMATKEDLERFATKEDLTELRGEVCDLRDEMRMKLDGINRRLDTEAMERREQNLPARVARIEKHLGLKSYTA